MPQGSHTGMTLNVLQRAGKALDYLFVMSYDAGNENTTGYSRKVGRCGPLGACRLAGNDIWG